MPNPREIEYIAMLNQDGLKEFLRLFFYLMNGVKSAIKVDFKLGKDLMDYEVSLTATGREDVIILESLFKNGGDFKKHEWDIEFKRQQ